jgi:hypothetical protein
MGTRLSLPETQIWPTASCESADNRSNERSLPIDLVRDGIGLVRSRAALQAEILVLRHQLNVLRHKSPKRVAVGNIDRLLFVGLYRFFPKVLDALEILKPRRSRVGIARVSGLIGAGNHGRAAGPAKDARGHSPAHSPDERCQSAVGSATDSWRTAQAWRRCRPDDRCKIHGKEKAATVARLEDLPSQSC